VAVKQELAGLNEHFKENFEQVVLFSESTGRLLVEIESNNILEFEELFKNQIVSLIGSTNEFDYIRIFNDDKKICQGNIEELKNIWKAPLSLG